MADNGDADVSVVAVSGVGGRGEFGGGGVVLASRAAVAAVTRGLCMMCWPNEGGRGRLGASMSSELDRMVGAAVVRGKTGSARLCLRLRRQSAPPSPSPPEPPAPPIPPVPAPALPLPSPPPPMMVGNPLPLRRSTKAGTLMRNREFREAGDLPVGNGGLSAGCGARNGTSGDGPRGEMGEMGEGGDDGTGEMDMTPLYPLERAANGVAELIEGEIGTSRMDDANVNAGCRRI